MGDIWMFLSPSRQGLDELTLCLSVYIIFHFEIMNHSTEKKKVISQFFVFGYSFLGILTYYCNGLFYMVIEYANSGK